MTGPAPRDHTREVSSTETTSTTTAQVSVVEGGSGANPGSPLQSISANRIAVVNLQVPGFNNPQPLLVACDAGSPPTQHKYDATLGSLRPASLRHELRHTYSRARISASRFQFAVCFANARAKLGTGRPTVAPASVASSRLRVFASSRLRVVASSRLRVKTRLIARRQAPFRDCSRNRSMRHVASSVGLRCAHPLAGVTASRF